MIADTGWTTGCIPFYKRMRTITGMLYGEREFAAHMRLMDKLDPLYRL